MRPCNAPSMTGVSVQYSAFGAMAVSVDGEEVPLTRRRERGVLSVLLAAHGAPVAAERLVAEVWGDEAPGQTLAALQVAVSRLRSQLEPDRKARTGSRLVSTAAGYSLVAEPGDVDTWTFEPLASQALAAGHGPRSDCGWPTRPSGLVGVAVRRAATPRSCAETSRLEELLLTLEELRARALVDLGRPDEALRGLAELAPQHPYRERLWALLALAQYQCSRQADALHTLRRLREHLADELGVDPSEEIRELEEAVLRQDRRPSRRTGAPSPGRASRSHLRRARRRRPRPASDGRTIGRAAVLDAAASPCERARTTGSLRFLLVAGEPGIGKSRLVADVGDAAAQAGFRVLVGRCHEGDYAPALWPWLAIVRALSEGARRDPLLVPLLEGEVTEPPPVPAPGCGCSTPWSTWSRVRVELPAAAGARGHPLGRQHLAPAAPPPRPVRDRRCRSPVLCTRRTTEATTGEALVDTLAVLAQAGAERLRLDGLDDASVGGLLTASVGEHDPQLDAFVAEVTGGNPFFVLQYARQLAGVPDLDARGAGLSARARRHPRRPAPADPAAAGAGRAHAHLGGGPRPVHRPGPGGRARRHARRASASTTSTSP